MKDSKIEFKVFGLAVGAALLQIGVIAYAALKLGITVPWCSPKTTPFQKASIEKVGDHRFEVHALAKMWSFSPQKIRVPRGSTVEFYVASQDVSHGFHILGTQVNLMAIPGAINNATARFDQLGTHLITCHEYCGSGHQNMHSEIEVVDSADASIDIGEGSAPTENDPVVAAAVKIFNEKACIGCHSLDGTPGVGPTFKGIWGRKEIEEDGSEVTVDAAYVRESILEPKKKIVKGFQNVMPELPMSDAEIETVINYFKRGTP